METQEFEGTRDVSISLTELSCLADLTKDVFARINPDAGIDWPDLVRRIGDAYVSLTMLTRSTMEDSDAFGRAIENSLGSKEQAQDVAGFVNKIIGLEVPIQLNYSEMNIIRDMVTSDMVMSHPIMPGVKISVGTTLTMKMFENLKDIRDGGKMPNVKDALAEIEAMGISLSAPKSCERK